MKHWEIEIFLYAQLKEIAKGKVVLDVGGGSEYSKWLSEYKYAYHGNNIYKDYYRFTKDGWKYLFRNFKDLEIVNIRGNSETMLHFLPPLIRRCKPLQGLCRVIDKRLSNNQVSGYFVYARKA